VWDQLKRRVSNSADDPSMTTRRGDLTVPKPDDEEQKARQDSVDSTHQSTVRRVIERKHVDEHTTMPTL
jgi:hypothetical protein